MKKKLSKIEKYLIKVKKNTGRDRAREMVRIRDNHTCLDCGIKLTTLNVLKTNSLIKGLKGKIKCLDVHHINKQCGKNSRGFDSTKNLSGMITLCHKCHFNRPEHRVHSKEFKKNISKGKLGMSYKKSQNC